jgi:hypothetical protein
MFVAERHPAPATLTDHPARRIVLPVGPAFDHIICYLVIMQTRLAERTVQFE